MMFLRNDISGIIKIKLAFKEKYYHSGSLENESYLEQKYKLPNSISISFQITSVL